MKRCQHIHGVKCITWVHQKNSSFTALSAIVQQTPVVVRLCQACCTAQNMGPIDFHRQFFSCACLTEFRNVLEMCGQDDVDELEREEEGVDLEPDDDESREIARRIAEAKAERKVSPGKALKGGFTFKGKCVFLTYSNTCFDVKEEKNSISREIIENHFKGEQFGAIKGIICAELHRSGKWHFHCLLYFADKIQTKNVKFFDIPCEKCGGHHPNIQRRAQKGREQWEQTKIEYCMKEDINYLTFGNFLPAFFKNSKGFTKAKQDYDNWIVARQKAKLSKVTEFKLPHNPKAPINLYEIPDLKSNKNLLRRRLLVFHGEPGCGKTRWVQETFADKKAYVRDHTKYPYEKLSDESVIIWDDIPLDTPNVIEEIIHLLNINSVRTHVYGDARYAGNYYPANSIRVIIWIMNTDRLVNWAHVLEDPRIVSRLFIKMKVEPVVEEEVVDMEEDEGPIVVD